ncbi:MULTISPECIES: hypothetical protein [Nostoc]|uniref:Uncharacterized protein n=2 Tax=Nostoc TaxID=1177 RepID=A0ABR8IE38_9NOSO|nr:MULTISPECIES: hypothetical protein [Nostoc]MBD2564380.1 hypothetical protein [Nostoc linckia FACHB-391]MBD2649529.1 hypothetical protein [Nostoc foliaceum FACHB-393]
MVLNPSAAVLPHEPLTLFWLCQIKIIGGRGLPLEPLGDHKAATTVEKFTRRVICP